ncbi:MAG: hypothetical protein R3Y62_07105, partial [Eubacteriales bacterium]
MTGKKIWGIWGLALGLILAWMMALSLGRLAVPLEDVWKILFQNVLKLPQTWEKAGETALLQVR